MVLPSMAVLAALLLMAGLLLFDPGASKAADPVDVGTAGGYAVLAAATSEIPSSTAEPPQPGDAFLPVMLGAGTVMILLGVGLLFLFRRVRP